MGYEAALKALDAASLTAKDIDLIIFATITPDTCCPSAANWLQAKLEAPQAVTFDVTAACSGFIFGLKGVIREVIGDQIGDFEKWKDLADLESRIDRVALLAFEKYTECREQLHRVRNREIEGRAMRVLERVKVEPAISVDEEEPTDDDA